MSLTLVEIARLVDGEVTGDGELVIRGAATLSGARAGEITFAESAKLDAQLARSEAAAVVTPPEYHPQDRPYITVPNVLTAFVKIAAHFRPPRTTQMPGISPAAFVHPTAKLAANVDVHPQAFIGTDVEIGGGTVIHSGVRILDGCTIGRGCVLYPNVVLYENTVLGDRVLIHAGAVLGAFGFGYSRANGRHQLCSQIGYVEVGDDVDIGANTTIDRGSYGPTIIGTGTKIDNQVQIGHNGRIGRHNLLCAQVGIAGSCTTGDYVVMAGQAGLADHLNIGEGAAIGAQSGLMHDARPGKRYFGTPAAEEKQFFRLVSIAQQLPEIRKQLHEVQRAIIRMAGVSEAPLIVDDCNLPRSEAA